MNAETTPTANPLLAAWSTPFGVPPFPDIAPAHFETALAHAMAEHRAEIGAIVDDPAPPDFGNTILALERTGRGLGRLTLLLDNLVASLGGDALDAVDREMAPRLAAHDAAIALDQALFARVDAVHAERASLGLDEAEMRLLERIHRGFVRQGAACPPEARERLAAIAGELATLHTAFGQNVTHDERAWTLPLGPEDLDGLPPFLRDGAAEAARERGLSGHVVTLSRSVVEPFLTFSPRRDLREAAYRAWTSRGMSDGPHDNRPLIRDILALRRERARLLGFRDHARFALDNTMAGSPEAARTLLETVWPAAVRKAADEEARLAEDARRDGLNTPLEPWDWRFYADRVRRADYALDEAALKPFFPLDAVERAAFETAERLFGIRIAPAPALPVYHPDVRAYEVRDRDGAHVGVFLADHFARPGKRSGAWMHVYRAQDALDGPVTPIVVNNNNFAKAEPTLLSFDDGRTLFHEFGHALHGLLSRVRFPTQSGTSVKRDFVELPSQIYEHWFALPETLRTHARHHQTGEPISDEWIARIRAAELFNKGFASVEFTSSALIDMALHEHPDPASLDVDAFERDVLAGIGMPRAIGLRHRPAHFGHLFSGDGYSAGYYAYLWSEVLDADGFEAFREAGDPFDPALAARLHAIYASGDTRDPMALYVAFRGREPSTAALLRGRGLVAGAGAGEAGAGEAGAAAPATVTPG